MRPFLMVVGVELGNKIVDVLLTEYDEIVQAFLLQSLNEPLDEDHRVACDTERRLRRDRLHLQAR